jgi:hypothetical protein
MSEKEPVVLVVLVGTARLRWFVAAVGLPDGAVTPLVCSPEGDLATYQGLGFDDQVSFLRHRFCGIVQRGCDRLWPVGKKARQFAFLFDGTLPETTADLTVRVAEHFVEWMLNPPVVVFTATGDEGGPELPGFRRLAGTLDQAAEEALRAGLDPLRARVAEPGAWEVSQRKGTWQPSG